MKVSFLFALIFMSFGSFAQEYYCSPWTRVHSVSCVYAGRTAQVWARQCENPCTYRNYDPKCDLDRLCHNDNPNEFESECSRWTADSGVTCVNPNTGRWEQKWIRACQVGLATQWCSDKDPNR